MFAILPLAATIQMAAPYVMPSNKTFAFSNTFVETLATMLLDTHQYAALLGFPTLPFSVPAIFHL